MKINLKAMRWMAVLSLAMALPLQVGAQATRTWVSGVGDDVNPCSRTAPCKTFAGAISKTAAGGEINVLDPGGYGAVTITKSMTINGEGTFAGSIVAGGSGIVVNAGPNDIITLRNIELESCCTTLGINGINFLNGGQLNVERVHIYGFSTHGIAFTPGGNAKLLVSDSSIHGNGGSGIHIAPGGAASAVATVVNTSLYGNARGLRAEDRSKTYIRNSNASGNSGNGFIANGVSSSVEMTLDATSSVANAAAGVFSGPLSTIRISRMVVSGNGTGLFTSGGLIISTGTNAVFGNGTDGAPTSTGGAM
jgi:hypothetical protein